MTAETIHTCSYSCDRPACIRAQRDELAARMTAETSNARGEVVAWIYKERYGHDDSAWIERIERTLPVWEHKDARPLYATPPPPADAEVRAPDVAMALHWIDRYAAGIDDECQIDLVADALGVTLPDGYGLSQQPEARVYQCPRCATSMEVDPTAKPEARGVVDEVIGKLPADLTYSQAWPQDYVNGWNDALRLVREELPAALTEARNVR